MTWKVKFAGRRLVVTALVLLVVRPAAAGAQDTVRVLSLDEVVELAVQRDPAAVAAEAAVWNARTDALQAVGTWLPSINVVSSYNNSSNQRFDQATGRLFSESYTAQLQGGIDIFTGGRRLLGQRSARAQFAAADAQYATQQYATILRATEVYYAAAAAADIVHAAEQRLQRARDQLTAAETRLELGTATQSDVLRAELEMGNAEAALLDAEASERYTTLELGRQTGHTGRVRPAEEALPDHAPVLPPVEVLVEQATRTAPAVIAAGASLRLRRAERLAAFTPYLPTVRLTGGYDWFAIDFPPEQRSWSLRLAASLPVFNGFQREAAFQRASAAERVAEARARDAELATRVAVESAASDIELAGRRVAIADRAVVLAREDLRVQDERYTMGVATILDLQTSQVNLSDAEINAVRARQLLGTATARLEAILGQRLRQEL
jgi:outer membrane protein